MIDYSDIKRIHLEISTRCNASCPLCPRNQSGYDNELGYPVHDMTLDEARKIFPKEFLSQLTNILINGNFGDFVTARDGLAIVEYFVESNPNIKILISTNAGAKPNIWAKLGVIPNVTVGFDLDGLADTHSLYRRNTDWNIVIDNARSFIAAGGKAIWRMIRFDHNQHQIEDCRAMSKEMGFSRFEILDDGRDSGPVYDRQGNFAYQIGNDQNFAEIKYPLRIEEWVSWAVPGALPENRLKEYKTIPIKQTVDCYSKKMEEIYITATGEIYPCCWLGFYPKQEYRHDWQADNMFLKELVQNNNALEVGIKDSIAWFNSVEASWLKQSYADGRMFKCDEYCGH